MKSEQFDINNTQVQMILVVKLQQLQREVLPTLTYRCLEEYVSEKLWKDKLPSSLHDAADQILRVTADDIVHYMSRKALFEGRRGKLSDFADVIGGK